MSKSLRLHPKLGVNPHVVNTHCFACGKTKADGLVLLGASNHKRICPQCGLRIYGGFSGIAACPKCGKPTGCEWQREEVGEFERLEQNGICSECQGHMKQGVIMVSVRDGEEGSENPYRTGGWWVIKEEALRRVVRPPELLEAICKKRMAFVPDSVCRAMGLSV